MSEKKWITITVPYEEHESPFCMDGRGDVRPRESKDRRAWIWIRRDRSEIRVQTLDIHEAIARAWPIGREPTPANLPAIQARHDAAGDGRCMDLGEGWQAHEDRGDLLDEIGAASEVLTDLGIPDDGRPLAERIAASRVTLPDPTGVWARLDVLAGKVVAMGEEIGPRKEGRRALSDDDAARWAADILDGADADDVPRLVTMALQKAARDGEQFTDKEMMRGPLKYRARNEPLPLLPPEYVPAAGCDGCGNDPGQRHAVDCQPLACLDCDAPYDGKRLDVVLPHDQWRAVHPDEDGILCGSCIARRARGLPGAVRLAARVEFAVDDPLAASPCAICGRTGIEHDYHPDPAEPLAPPAWAGTREATIAKLPADIAATIAPLTASLPDLGIVEASGATPQALAEDVAAQLAHVWREYAVTTDPLDGKAMELRERVRAFFAGPVAAEKGPML